MASSLAIGGVPAGAAAAAAQAAAAEGAAISQVARAAGAAAGAAVTSLGGSPTEAGVASSQGNKKNATSESFPVLLTCFGK